MTDISDTPVTAEEPKILGPFLGQVTSHSIKIWLHLERKNNNIYVSLHPVTHDAAAEAFGLLTLLPEKLFTDCVTIDGLRPNTRYFYRLWTNEARSIPLNLDGLTEKELCFYTLSENTDDQIDFLIMSCHNPTVAEQDGFDGHAVWADIPQIIAGESNRRVRLALLVGDQVYADDWQERLLAEPNEEARRRLYLSVYRKFWSNIHYRRVMCSLPAVMMWDDHDITDGWGSRADSFVEGTSKFKPEWQHLFEAASSAFSLMQASRNPAPLSKDPVDGFDCCFRIGSWGFVLLDLRTHRNLMQHQMITPAQADRIRSWVDANKQEMHTLFIVSPVVFSHGSPVIEDFTVGIWPGIMRGVDWLAGKAKWGKSLQTKFGKTLGDIRDDIKDSWGANANAAQADLILDYLFNLQNDPEHSLSIVVLSGDIHASGYANIYSNDPNHVGRSSIPHITSSSVSYSPFNWLMEAVYRHASKTVALGTKGSYSSQISHHFCSRSVAVLSIRPKGDEGDHQLKVKYYLEGFPEPQILLFDLSRTSHRENIAWVAQQKLFTKDYAPTANIDVEALLVEKAKQTTQKLNWGSSIVDLLKLLNLDSSLGARKQLAQKLGYTGALNGSADMNVWLHEQVVKRLQEGGGSVEGLP